MIGDREMKGGVKGEQKGAERVREEVGEAGISNERRNISTSMCYPFYE